MLAFNMYTLRPANRPAASKVESQESSREMKAHRGKRKSWELPGSICNFFHGLNVKSFVHFAKHEVAITGANCSDYTIYNTSRQHNKQQCKVIKI